MSARRKTINRRDFLKMTAAGLAMGTLGFPAIVKAARSPSRPSCIVLGIDGMDPTLLMRFIREGLMPNARQLIARGKFAPLRTSDPPQSPVAWANVTAGTDPGGHGIYDFIARDPDTLKPFLSTARMEGHSRKIKIGGWEIPLISQAMSNRRRGPVFWNDLEAQGVPCTVIRMPANFPPTKSNARTLAGLGTPDIHGSYGIFTYYTDKPDETTRDLHGGHLERVFIKDHTVRTILPGPLNSLKTGQPAVDLPLVIHLDPINPAVLIRIDGQEIVLREREWSPWVKVAFPLMGSMVKVHGICRFYLKKTRRDFELYTTPVNIDPEQPTLPLSTPSAYARDLAGVIGPFYTQGMAEDTSALSANVFDDTLYRQQACAVLEESRRIYRHELNRFKDGFLFMYFSSLDLNSHVFWRTLDTGHPLYTPELAAHQGDFIPWLYRQMDNVIGEALERVDDNTTLMVMSDHGFGSFRRQFNLNSWLMDNGYAALASGSVRGEEAYFAEVDWTKTRAYGLGINSLYFNQRGREPEGQVNPGDDADALARELIQRLTALRDPATGDKVISRVCRPREIYHGPYLADAPDLLVCYAPNYRASWDTVLGKYPREIILDNREPWSGDHTMDSFYMSGVFLCNRSFAADTPALYDVAPTLLGLFGAPRNELMTGTDLFKRS